MILQVLVVIAHSLLIVELLSHFSSPTLPLPSIYMYTVVSHTSSGNMSVSHLASVTSPSLSIIGLRKSPLS